MTRKFYLGMAALVTLAAFTAARAEEVDVASLEDFYAGDAGSNVEQVSTMNISSRFASMEAELESLRAQVQQVSFGGGGGKGCNDCGAVGCNCYCDIGCGGWYAGIDAVIVKPFAETGAFVEVDDDTGTRTFEDPTYDYEISPRVWVGYRNCEGLGIRARWWNFDQDSPLTEIDDTTDTDVEFVFHSLDVTAVDLEVTQLVCWGPLQMNFAGGVRYGKVESLGVEIDVTDDNVDAGLTDFEGFGPTVAMEARRPIGCRGLALIGNVRGSMLFGDSKDLDVDGDADVVFTPDEVDTFENEDKLSYVLETQVGVEYRRCLGNGILSLRAMMEGQIWDYATNDSYFNTDSQPDSALGFFGATIGAEYSR